MAIYISQTLLYCVLCQTLFDVDFCFRWIMHFLQELRRAMLEKFEKEKQVEPMTAERKRREVAAYRQQVEQLIASRRQEKEVELAREIAAQQVHQQREAARLEVVDQERQRLLLENADLLQHFLPRGLFRSPEEYARFMSTMQRR